MYIYIYIHRERGTSYSSGMLESANQGGPPRRPLGGALVFKSQFSLSKLISCPSFSKSNKVLDRGRQLEDP